MRRFKFGGFGGSKEEQERPASASPPERQQQQAASGASWMPPDEREVTAFGPQPAGSEQQPGQSQPSEAATAFGPSTGDFVWPSSTPSSTAGQPEATGEDQGGGAQAQPVAAWSQV